MSEPIRLVAEEENTSDAAEIEVHGGNDWLLLPDNQYQATLLHSEALRLRMFRGAPRLFIHFEIIDPGPFMGQRIYGAWPLAAIRNQGGKQRLTVKPRSDLHIMGCRLLGSQSRIDRFSFSRLKGCVVTVRTRTVQRNFRQRQYPESLKYSVVDDILEIVAGAG